MAVTHYCLFRAALPASPMVKEADFFVAAGGLEKDWGKGWETVEDATSIGDARRKFAALKGVTLSPIYHGEN